MAFKSDLSFSDNWLYPDSCPPVQGLPPGICEVIGVEASDELPYVFEISAGERLSFCLSATHEVDLVLCDEPAYDEWVDGGFQSEHPANPILMLRHGCQHSLEFRTDQDATLIAILINLADRPVQAVVAATVLDSSGKLC